jgi:hypothetical protein
VDGKEKHRFHGWERGIKDRLKGKELHGGAGDRGKIFKKEKILPDCNTELICSEKSGCRTRS